ncbi:hypothetical protein V1515DRAFT_595471 [Lipomyces mesembrius]
MPTDNFGEEEDYAFLMPSRPYISPPGSASSSLGKHSSSNLCERSVETMSTDDEDSYSVISNISNMDEEEFNDNMSIFSSTGVRSAASSSSSEAEYEAAYGHDESAIPQVHESVVYQDIPHIPDELSGHLAIANESLRDRDEIFGQFGSARLSDLSAASGYDLRCDTNALGESDTAESRLCTLSRKNTVADNTDVLNLQTVIAYCILYINDFFNWISFRYNLLSAALVLGIPNVIYFSNTDNSDVLIKVQPKLINAYKCAPSVLISPLTSFLLSWLENLGYLPRFISWVPNISRCEYVSLEQGDRFIAIDTMSDGQNSRLYAVHGDCFAGLRLNRRTCPDLIVVHYDPAGPRGITSRMMENLRRVSRVVNVPILILSDAKQQVQSQFDFLAERASMARRLSGLCQARDSSISISTNDLIDIDDYDIYNALISASRSSWRVDSLHSVPKGTPVRANKSSVYEKTVWNRLVLGAVVASLAVCLHIFCPSVPYGVQLHQTDFRFHVISKNNILLKAPTVMGPASFWSPALHINPSFDVDTVSHAYGECVLNPAISEVFGDEALITLDPKDAWGDINITISSMAFKKWYIVNLGGQEYANDYDDGRDSILQSFKAWTTAERANIRFKFKELYTDYVKPAAKGFSDCSADRLMQLGASISKHCSEYSKIIDWPAVLNGYNVSLISMTRSGNQGALFVKTKYDTAKEFSSQRLDELSQWLSGIARSSGEQGASLWAGLYTSWQKAEVSMEPAVSSVSGHLKSLNSKVYEIYRQYKIVELKSSVSNAGNAHRKLVQASNKFVEGFNAAHEDARSRHHKNKAAASKKAKKIFDKYVKNKRRSKHI